MIMFFTFRIWRDARVSPHTMTCPRLCQANARVPAARRPSSPSCVWSVPAVWSEPWPRRPPSSSSSGDSTFTYYTLKWEKKTELQCYGLCKPRTITIMMTMIVLFIISLHCSFVVCSYQCSSYLMQKEFYLTVNTFVHQLESEFWKWFHQIWKWFHQ